jgi:hypothetical protein
MIDDLDILRAVNILIKRYGADAAIQAAQRADQLIEAGDIPAVASRAVSRRGDIWTETLLELRELAPANALVVELEVVAKGRGEELGRLRRGDRCSVPLPRLQGAHKRQPLIPLGFEYPDPCILASLSHHRLGAHKIRREHDLVAENKAINDEVVAVDLAAPGLGRGWSAHNAHPVIPLVILFDAPCDGVRAIIFWPQDDPQQSAQMVPIVSF